MIFIHKSDSTIFANVDKFLIFYLATDLDLTGFKAIFTLGTISKTIDDISSKSFEVILSSQETSKLNYGKQYGELKLIDADNNIKTVLNTLAFCVTPDVIDNVPDTVECEIPQSTEIDVNITIGQKDAPVMSVNGKIGDVVLNAEDVGALPADTFIPEKTSDIINDSDFQNALQVNNAISSATSTLATKAELTQGLATKQNTISDLDSIRSGAGLGSTSLQPNDNISELNNNANYQNATQVQEAISTATSTLATKTELTQGLATKQNIIEDLDDIRTGAGLGETSLQHSDIINNVTSTATDKALSANMGKELQDQITNLKSRGRYLSIWNCTTGLAETTPTVDPYEYRAGDYFIVGVIGATNYKPVGAYYSESTPSTTVETGDVKVNDTYYYDGTTWTLLDIGQVASTFSSLGGSPYDNSNLASALNSKQATLESGTNIKTINNQSLLGSGNVNIQSGTLDHSQLTNRDIANQHPISAITNLQDALDDKQNTISDLQDIRSGAELGSTSIQPNDNITQLTNNANYQTANQVEEAINTATTNFITLDDLSATAPIQYDSSNGDISISDATTSSKGVVKVGDLLSVNNGTLSATLPIKGFASFNFPEELQMVEYAYTSGCFLTNVTPTNNFKVEAYTRVHKYQNGAYQFVCYTRDANGDFGLEQTYSGSNVSIIWIDKSRASATGIIDTEQFIETGIDGAYITGGGYPTRTKISDIPKYPLAFSHPIYLFAHTNNDGTIGSTNGKNWQPRKIRLLNGETLEAEYIACYCKEAFTDSTGTTHNAGTIGLYDTVSGKLELGDSTWTKGSDYSEPMPSTVNLENNSIYKDSVSQNMTFNLPTPVDTSKNSEILMVLTVTDNLTINWGTPNYLGGSAPDTSRAGTYLIKYVYANGWYVGLDVANAVNSIVLPNYSSVSSTTPNGYKTFKCINGVLTAID